MRGSGRSPRGWTTPASRPSPRVLVALGRAAHDHPAIAEIDVNPVRVADGRAVALDALVVAEEEPR